VSQAVATARGEVAPPAATGGFVRPGTGALTSSFGPRLHPILGYVKVHTGTDLGRGDGYVYAAASGTVVTTGWGGAYGLMTVIDHGDVDGAHLTTLYAHQSAQLVEVGDSVVRGQRIGVIGSTGYSTGPHLHVEVRLDGVPVDPWPWLVDAPLPGGGAD
jgi:murein DD-endopeptidase MepM/ murein hydrolase activator NlpD